MGQSMCSKVVRGDGQVDVAVLNFVASVTLFSYLDFEEHEMIARSLREKGFEDMEEVVHEGDKGDAMYIIQSGKAIVSCHDSQVAKLGPGDYFGEMALIWDAPRNATVAAKGALKVLSLSRQKFSALELSSALHFPKRACINPGAGESKASAKKSPKAGKRRMSLHLDAIAVTPEEVKFIADALGGNTRLSEAMDFSRDTLEAMAENCQIHHFKVGELVIKQGDKVAESMYIVKSGDLSIQILEKGSRATVSTVGKYSAGDSFGELALLFDSPRAATISATTEVDLYELHRHAFKLSLRTMADKKTDEVAQFIGDAVPCLATLLEDERRNLAEHLVAVHYEANEVIFHARDKGDEAKEFMILHQGEIFMDDQKAKKDKDLEIRYNKPGQLVGCEEFLAHETYKVPMVAGKDGAVLFILDRSSFTSLLANQEKNIREAVGAVEGAPKKRKSISKESSRLQTYSDYHFQHMKRVRVLGAGGFGVVWLVEPGGGCCSVGHNGAGTMALKSISKGLIVKEKVQAAVQNEKKILSIMSDNPLIIHLYGTHQDPEHVYFLMEMAAMDLQQAYAMNKLFGSAPVAAFHVASLACALEALHVRRIAYRDVKPENILLVESGRVKLCDMGIAKLVPGLTHSVVGTPEFCAPEVFSGQGYSTSCDWWSLGVLTLELMSGGNPFSKGNDILKTIAAVKKGFGKNKDDDNIPYVVEKNHPEIAEFVKQVCQKKPKSRLPVGKTGQDDTAEFKEHTFFKGIDWEKVANGTHFPPFVPPVGRKPKPDPKPEHLPNEVKLEKGKEKCEWAEDF